MKVKIDSDYLEVSQEDIFFVVCGNCGSEIESYEWNYCPICGEEIEYTKESMALFEQGDTGSDKEV